MSKDTSIASKKLLKPTDDSDKDVVKWGIWFSILITVVVVIGAQLVAVLLVDIYPLSKHWNQLQTQNWLNNSVNSQFFSILLAEAITVGLILWVVLLKKSRLSSIGLKRPKWVDLAYLFAGFAIYFVAFILAVGLLKALIPSLNLLQAQDTGFGTSITGWPLVLVFVSLVILPPIAEEITFRGFLFSGLKKKLPVVWAIILTSLIFASPHLLEGKGGGVLWIAGIDTFVLSVVLCWIRQKTGRLYAGIGIHALKNFIAFVELYHIFTFHF